MGCKQITLKRTVLFYRYKIIAFAIVLCIGNFFLYTNFEVWSGKHVQRRITAKAEDQINLFANNYVHNHKANFKFYIQPWRSEESIWKKTFCKTGKNATWSMVFVFKSTAHNFDRRLAIRETWGSVKIYDNVKFEYVFVLGTTKNERVTEAVKRENQTHGDILQFTLEDSSKTVPEKVLAGMQWASGLPNNNLYASIDDDVIVDHERLVTFYSGLVSKYKGNDGSIKFDDIPIVCVYSYQKNDFPSRDPSSKWFVSRKEYSGKAWPAYCRGGLYTMNRKLTEKLLNASKLLGRLQMDDVWVTGIMRRKADIDDSKIIGAQGSNMSEKELHSREWHSQALVHHFWGNMNNMKVDVPVAMRKQWGVMAKRIQSRAKCILQPVNKPARWIVS